MNKRQRKKKNKEQRVKYSNLIALALTNDMKFAKGFLEEEIKEMFKKVRR